MSDENLASYIDNLTNIYLWINAIVTSCFEIQFWQAEYEDI